MCQPHHLLYILFDTRRMCHWNTNDCSSCSCMGIIMIISFLFLCLCVSVCDSIASNLHKNPLQSYNTIPIYIQYVLNHKRRCSFAFVQHFSIKMSYIQSRYKTIKIFIYDVISSIILFKDIKPYRRTLLPYYDLCSTILFQLQE